MDKVDQTSALVVELIPDPELVVAITAVEPVDTTMLLLNQTIQAVAVDLDLRMHQNLHLFQEKLVYEKVMDLLKLQELQKQKR